jgi:hypothetical protein
METGWQVGGEDGFARRSNTKRTGEFSEAAFLMKASAEGFAVTKPWGDSERYDFIVDSGRRLSRVQLKCTATLRARGYDVQSIYSVYGRGKVCYTAEEIDVLVAYIIPTATWYVLPIEVFAPARSLRFYPDIECKRAKWEGYREAWGLMRK